jgi:hypothetical protein
MGDKERDKDRDDPVSLAPLDPADALRALLAINPQDEPEDKDDPDSD